MLTIALVARLKLLTTKPAFLYFELAITFQPLVQWLVVRK